MSSPHQGSVGNYVEIQKLQSGIRDRQNWRDECMGTIREYELQLTEGKNDMERHKHRILDLYDEHLTDSVLTLGNFNISSNKIYFLDDNIENSVNIVIK